MRADGETDNIKLVKLSAILLSAVLLGAFYPPARANSWENNQISGQWSGISTFLPVSNIDTQEKWDALWAKHSRGINSFKTQPPAVDFSKEMVVGVFLGSRECPGYSIKLEARELNDAPETLFVVFSEIVPAQTETLVEQVMTEPFTLLKVPKKYKNVHVVPLASIKEKKAGLVDLLNSMPRLLKFLKIIAESSQERALEQYSGGAIRP